MMPRRKYHSYLLFKPYGIVSQFSRSGGKKSLADLGTFPDDVYPAGRLDEESEGLLVLTNNNELKCRLTEPRYGHPRTYLVQVERVPDAQALHRLRSGVVIDGRATKPAIVHFCDAEPELPPRPVSIRFRKSVPTAWLEMTLFEGRNRQVRRMTAAVGHPTLRLVRIRLGRLTTEGLRPGEWRRLTSKEVASILGRE